MFVIRMPTSFYFQFLFHKMITEFVKLLLEMIKSDEKTKKYTHNVH